MGRENLQFHSPDKRYLAFTSSHTSLQARSVKQNVGSFRMRIMVSEGAFASLLLPQVSQASRCRLKHRAYPKSLTRVPVESVISRKSTEVSGASREVRKPGLNDISLENSPPRTSLLFCWGSQRP